MKKKIIIIIISLIAVSVVFLIAARLLTGEDSWICQDGQWVKHGRPSAPRPTEPCGEIAKENVPAAAEEAEVVVFSPKSGEEVWGPLTVEGKARGYWFFEASFPIRLVDGSGKILASGIAQAQSDWMTTEYVPFKAVLEFFSSQSGPAELVLQKDNPSGLPENAKEIRWPVIIKGIETAKTKIYFSNNKLDPKISCDKVFPVEREVPSGMNAIRFTVEQLLKGPTEAETTEGYFTTINSAVKIQKLTVEEGIAEIDFDQQLEFQVGGSCRVSAIRAQITETLKQFPEITLVIISVNGRTEDVLQP